MFVRPSNSQIDLEKYREKNRDILDSCIRQHDMKSHTVSTIDDLDDNETTFQSFDSTNQRKFLNLNNNRKYLNVRTHSGIELTIEKNPLFESLV